MEAKILNEQGIYYLDEEVGNENFYIPISYSKPERLNDVEVNISYNMEEDTYSFNIDGYDIKSLDCCPDFMVLEFINRLRVIIRSIGNVLATINQKEGITYIVAMPEPSENDETRFIILNQDRIIQKDFILSGKLFIKKFNQEFHKIYDKYYQWLIDNYVEECQKRTTVVSQEHTLNQIKKYTDIFDKYLEDPEYFNKSYSNPPVKWQGKKIISATDLENYFNSIKDKIIGKSIDNIYIKGINYSYSSWDEIFEFKNGKWYQKGKLANTEPDYYPWKTENTKLFLDDVIVLCFGEEHLEIEYWSGSLVHAALNTLDVERDCNCSVSNNFSKNIIGHKLVDIQIHKTDEVYFMNFDHLGIERNDGDDMFEEIWFVFENGYKLELTTDHCDYTWFSEIRG